MFSNNDDMREFYEERLAIALEDGGLPYHEAHQLAMMRTENKWPLQQRTHNAGYPPTAAPATK